MSVHHDEDIVLAKTATVRRCLEVIRGLWFRNDPPLPGWVRLDVTVLNLQRAVEACLDLGTHLVAANSWRLPGSAAEVMEELAAQGVIPPEELPVLRAVIGFRNIAVHNYTAIDAAIVERIVREHLDDLERFVGHVARATVGATTRREDG